MKFTKPALKSCPFCGSAAKFHIDNGSYGYTPSTVRVKCTKEKCFAATESEPMEKWETGRGTYYVDAQAHAMVAEQWNTRATP